MWAATPGCFLQHCLEPGHVVSACRARTRCLVCYSSGHVARGCPLLYHEHGVPGAPHRRPVWVGASAPSPDTAKATPEQRTVTGESLLLYKARVCVEGVPAHARRMETVAGLFAGGGGFALVEGLDHGRLAEKEVECVCAWVWTRRDPLDPGAPGVVGLAIACPPAAAGPPRMLAYDVIIHLDLRPAVTMAATGHAATSSPGISGRWTVSLLHHVELEQAGPT
ncbi:hypothetical protein HU200_061839 [Digitaria exilis]|uniref:CCHC-type domain-containing protein n=1 Tax=Digitaria exilis TaxID=1010633 RepID=A0A835E0T9_9POAL|nr:hypothetical protein HU200_061839 [Digitaria exilis]